MSYGLPDSDLNSSLILERILNLLPDGTCVDANQIDDLLSKLHFLLLSGQKAICSLASVNCYQLGGLYSRLPPHCKNRYMLLHLLVMVGSPESLRLAVKHIKSSDVNSWKMGAYILSPLMQKKKWPIDAVFPEILDALQYPGLAGPILDLANHLVRNDLLEKHPASHRLDSLLRLFSQLVCQLESLERNPDSFSVDPTVSIKLLDASISILVSTCDAIGLIGNPIAIPKLKAALSIKHRRVRTEVASTLTSFRDEKGKDCLLQLAADPYCRLRVIQYCKELGIIDLVDQSFLTDEAVAEATLAIWLAEATQFGIAPTSVELIARRSLFWPGYTGKVDCFLLKFGYSFRDRSYVNIGICGPITYATNISLCQLNIDDVFAFYAGWHVENEEIVISKPTLEESCQGEILAVAKHSEKEGFASPQLLYIGKFFGKKVGIFEASKDEKQVLVLTDGSCLITNNPGNYLDPLKGTDLWYIYVGRALLRKFNS
jgi:hypothetical protein